MNSPKGLVWSNAVTVLIHHSSYIVSETLDTLFFKISGNLGKGLNGSENFQGKFPKNLKTVCEPFTSKSGQKFLGGNFRNIARFSSRKCCQYENFLGTFHDFNIREKCT